MRVITGSARGRRLATLPGDEIVRPTTDRVKEAMFSIIQFDLPCSNVLDLFSGSGQLGIEALSRGASKATFVDRSIDAFSVTKQNLISCGFFEQAVLLNSDSFTFLANTKEVFDIILLDPPYNNGFVLKALPLAADKLSDSGIIICETDYLEELPDKIGDIEKNREYKYSKVKLTTYKKSF